MLFGRLQKYRRWCKYFARGIVTTELKSVNQIILRHRGYFDTLITTKYAERLGNWNVFHLRLADIGEIFYKTAYMVKIVR